MQKQPREYQGFLTIPVLPLGVFIIKIAAADENSTLVSAIWLREGWAFVFRFGFACSEQSDWSSSQFLRHKILPNPIVVKLIFVPHVQKCPTAIVGGL